MCCVAAKELVGFVNATAQTRVLDLKLVARLKRCVHVPGLYIVWLFDTGPGSCARFSKPLRGLGVKYGVVHLWRSVLAVHLAIIDVPISQISAQDDWKFIGRYYMSLLVLRVFLSQVV